MIHIQNGANLTYTSPSNSAIKKLSKEVYQPYILLRLTHSSLSPIGKICDSGCTEIFNKKEVVIKNTTKQH